jgi:hypothetical protein
MKRLSEDGSAWLLQNRDERDAAPQLSWGVVTMENWDTPASHRQSHSRPLAGHISVDRAIPPIESALDQSGFDAVLRDADPALRWSFLIRTFLLAAVVSLMTGKPF